jgi:hypothetical protein
MKLVPLKSEAVLAKENMILERTIDLLQSGWCQSSYARDERGDDVWPEHDGAVSWCATGAIIRAMHDLNIGVAYEDCFDFSNPYYISILQRVQEQIPHQTRMFLVDDAKDEHTAVMCWNDSCAESAEEVILALKHALHGG